MEPKHADAEFEKYRTRLKPYEIKMNAGMEVVTISGENHGLLNFVFMINFRKSVRSKGTISRG